LERTATISKMESLSALIATNMATWQKNAGGRKRRKLRNVSNAIKRDTLQKTIKENSQ